MSDQTIIQGLLRELQNEGKGEYYLKYHVGEIYLEYYSKREEDCVYFEFDKDGKLLDISTY